MNVQAVDNMASCFFVFQIWLGDLYIIIGFAQDARCNCVQEAMVCGFWWSYSPSPIIMYLPCHLVRKTFLYVYFNQTFFVQNSNQWVVSPFFCLFAFWLLQDDTLVLMFGMGDFWLETMVIIKFSGKMALLNPCI